MSLKFLALNLIFQIGLPLFATASKGCLWSFQKIAPHEMFAAIAKSSKAKTLVEIDMFDVIKGDDPNKQYCTGGAGPCVALAIINQKTKIVYFGHFTREKIDEFEELIQQAVQEAKSPNDLKVVMAGGQIDSYPKKKDYEDKKKAAEEYAQALRSKLKDSKIKKIEDHLLLEPMSGAFDLFVDPGKKKIFLSFLIN